MRNSLFIAIVAVFGWAWAASAQPFSGSRLFVNHSMKVEMTRTFGVGADLTVAPVKAAQKKLVSEFRDNYQQEAAAITLAAQYVSPDDIRNSNPAELAELLKNSGAPLTDEQKAQIDSAIGEAQANGVDQQMLGDLFEIMSEPESAITFSLEPHLWLHFSPVDLYFTVPVAGFFGDETEFAFGNIGVDARFGHTFGEDFSFGISYGLQLWAPTATEQANALGVANLAWSPRYFNEYLTVAPYLVLGTDLKFVTLQANLAYNGMFAAKGSPQNDQVHYLQWGTGLSITAIPFTILSAELSGLAGLDNAKAYDTVFLTAGLRFVARIIDIGVGAQIPLVKADTAEVGTMSGVTLGSPADVNVIVSFTIGI